MSLEARESELKNRENYIELMKSEIKARQELINELVEVINYREKGTEYKDIPDQPKILETLRFKIEMIENHKIISNLRTEIAAKEGYNLIFKNKVEYDKIEYKVKSAMAEKNFKDVVFEAERLAKNTDVPKDHRESMIAMTSKCKTHHVNGENKVKIYERLQNDISIALDHLRKINK